MNVQRLPLDWCGRAVEVEYAWVGVTDAQAPCMVFLHEGLGSLALWKDFPHTLCVLLGCRGLVYSRPGYGQSTPRAPGEVWGPDFMHRQAYEVLPAVLAELGMGQATEPGEVAADIAGLRPTGSQKLWLFGHSDGASIALLFAQRYAAQVAGSIVLAPHTFVEDKCITAIAEAHASYASTGMAQRLARYHQSPDSAFGGWSGAWLNPAFRAWNIDAEVARIRTPMLAVQGVDDAYGTLEQVHRIARHTPHTEVLELPHCGHSPHRDQPQAVLQASQAFFTRWRGFR